MPSAADPWGRLLERARSSRALGYVVFLAGVYLLALPLVFTVFAHEAGRGGSLPARVALTVIWFLCAVVVGVVALLHELDTIEQRAREVAPRIRRAGRRRELAALTSIDALLRPGATGFPASFRFAAFIPDRDGILRPVLEPNPQPWQRWPPGHGVVGVAWEEKNAFVQAVGVETRDPAFGLTPDQREHYGDLTYVAGRTIFDEDGQAVGVLSVSCEDGSDFVAEGGLERFRVLASDMGILVGDARPADG